MARKLVAGFWTALQWSLAWGIGGAALIAPITLLTPSARPGYWHAARPVTLLSVASGFLAGLVFSATLAIVHRRHDLDELRPARMALWGGAAGLLLPLALVGAGFAGGLTGQGDILGTVALALAAIGAATAYGSVRIAQVGAAPVRLRDRTQ